MSVVVLVVICARCAGDGECKSVFAKLFLSKRIFFRELIVFRHLNMDFVIFFNVILSDLSILSVSRQKHNCEVKKYSHVDIGASCFERALQ